MAKRLVKVAKELNVGTTTLVEHLLKNGFKLENRPTAKVTNEMYDVLIKDFSKSIAIKERADKLTIGSHKRKEAEAAAREAERKRIEAEKRAQEEERKRIEAEKKAQAEKRRKDEIARIAEEKRKLQEQIEKDRKERAEKARLAKLKVIDKIDLNKTNKGKEAKKEEKPSNEDQPKKNTPENKSAGNSNKKEGRDRRRRDRKGDATDSKRKDGRNSDNKSKNQDQHTTKSAENKGEEGNKKDKSIQKQPEAKMTDQNEKPTKEDSEVDDTFRAKTPNLKGLKIKGKIDLNRFSKKPAAKKDKPSSEENKNKNKDGKDAKDKPKDRPTRERRGGRRRRRDIPTDSEKAGNSSKKEDGRKPIASSDGKTDTTSQRKRKRRKVYKEPDLVPKENDRSSTGGGDRPPTKVVRPPDERPRRRRRGDNRPGQGAKKQDDQPKEVSQKEIEEKIKATMARLSGGGKNKRQKIRRDNRERMRERESQREAENENDKLQVSEFITVSELASVMNVSATDVIMSCMNLGVIVSINQRLDAEIIELVAEEFGHEIEFISAEEQTEEEDDFEDDPKDLEERAPVVTVMGHVDHGKTSLLDYIRSANVASGEAGGITQHIGAYEVKVGEDDKKVTFLDTPGHEAFTAMRARGAKVTDIAVIIISADDEVMPQTKEAISHAQAADVPLIFAINKIDKPGAQPERIKQQLAEMDLLVEDWGGDYQSQDISAKKGTNIDELLEKIILEAEILELQANPKRPATGVVLEASLDKGRGYVTKILVQNGTLKVKDPIVAGAHAGRIRAMFNERGKRVKKAGPATPVLILGLSGAPQAGEKFKVMESEQDAKQLASKREQIAREQQQRAMKRVSLEDIGRRLKLGNFKELNLIIKGDVDGSIEALSGSLLKQSVETVQVKIVHRAVGPIKESDVLLASASDAIIIGFQVRPSSGAKQLAEREGVEIKMYSVIYDAIEEVRSAIEGLLEPTKEEKQVAEVEVREVFKISKVGTVAGCYVKEGKIARSSFIRIIREGIVVYPKKEGMVGELDSLKRFKDDVSEVKFGYECGLTIKNYEDIQAGDVIEAYEIIEVKQKLSNHNKITTA